jgi:hypothetical protein
MTTTPGPRSLPQFAFNLSPRIANALDRPLYPFLVLADFLASYRTS